MKNFVHRIAAALGAVAVVLPATGSVALPTWLAVLVAVVGGFALLFTNVDKVLNTGAPPTPPGPIGSGKTGSGSIGPLAFVMVALAALSAPGRNASAEPAGEHFADFGFAQGASPSDSSPADSHRYCRCGRASSRVLAIFPCLERTAGRTCARLRTRECPDRHSPSSPCSSGRCNVGSCLAMRGTRALWTRGGPGHALWSARSVARSGDIRRSAFFLQARMTGRSRAADRRHIWRSIAMSQHRPRREAGRTCALSGRSAEA